MLKITTLHKSSYLQKDSISLEEALWLIKEKQKSQEINNIEVSEMYECMPYYHLIVSYDWIYKIRLYDYIKNEILKWCFLKSSNKQDLLTKDIYKTLREYWFKWSSEEEFLYKEPEFDEF